MSNFKAKIGHTKIQLPKSVGGGAYSAPPDLLAGFKEA